MFACQFEVSSLTAPAAGSKLQQEGRACWPGNARFSIAVYQGHG